MTYFAGANDIIYIYKKTHYVNTDKNYAVYLVNLFFGYY